jgi:anti-sigma B factor antagonist
MVTARSEHFDPPGSATFAIRERELGEYTTLLAVEGELDLATAPRLKWELVDSLRSVPRTLVLDLSLATFMDSTALGVLVGVKRGMEPGQRLAIVCPTTDILKIFEFAGLDEMFSIFPTLEEALGDVRRHAAPSG